MLQALVDSTTRADAERWLLEFGLERARMGKIKHFLSEGFREVELKGSKVVEVVVGVLDYGVIRKYAWDLLDEKFDAEKMKKTGHFGNLWGARLVLASNADGVTFKGSDDTVCQYLEKDFLRSYNTCLTKG